MTTARDPTANRGTVSTHRTHYGFYLRVGHFCYPTRRDPTRTRWCLRTRTSTRPRPKIPTRPDSDARPNPTRPAGIPVPV